MPILIDTGRSTHGWSSIGDILVCPQKWAYNQDARSRGDEAEVSHKATDRGSCFHAGLAHHFVQKIEGVEPGYYYSPQDAMRVCKEGRKIANYDPELLVYLLNLLDEYIAAYAVIDADWEVLGVEKEFKVTVDGHLLTYKADRIIRHKYTGKVRFVDAKTTSGTLTNIDLRYVLTGQMLFARMLGEKYYPKFDGIIIDAVRCNPGIVNAQFQRLTLPEAPHALSRFRSNMKYALKLKDSFKDTPLEDHPRALNEQLCSQGKYGPCDFYSRCMTGEP